MGTLPSQILSFMTSQPGSVIYHILLVSSIAFAMQSAFYHWRASDLPQVRRTLIGLGALLGINLLIFIISWMGWSQLLNLQIMLPPLERAFVLLGLVWAIWLWGFPEPQRSADSAAALLSLLIAAISILSLIDANSAAQDSFNASLQDGLWQYASIGLILIGIIILSMRRPNGWANGVAFLVIAFIGHTLYLWSDRSSGNFPGVVRLAYIAAYPLLLTLPQRFPFPTHEPAIKPSATSAAQRSSNGDPRTFHALLEVAAETDPTRINQSLTHAIAQTMLADACYLIKLSEDKNHLQISAGYDLIRGEPLEARELDRTAIPNLTSAIQRGRSLRLSASGTSTDVKGLGDQLGIGNPGNLICVPILTREKESIGGLMLLSPYSDRTWSEEDKSSLTNIAASIVPIVQRNWRVTAEPQEGQISLPQQALLLHEIAQLKAEKEELSGQLQQALKTPFDVAGVTSPQVGGDTLERIQALENEIETLRIAGRSPAASELRQLEKELRITLKDTARLQNQLAESNMRVLQLEQDAKAKAPNEDAEVIASISQELRQPMSSIVGYTDLLLGESIGILGALQRKFLERIKASTERIGSLIDDLIQVTTLDTGQAVLKPETVDLNGIIDNAMSYTSSQLREKNITMHLDLPKVLAPIHADREALQQILIHLLQNAGAATPVEGDVTLKVQTRKEADKDYVLIQVTDNGGGIAAEDVPRVFTRLYRADNVLIQGVGDTGVGLSIAKTLTEAQKGRIWVETKPGSTTTFSVLLPIPSPVEAGGR